MFASARGSMASIDPYNIVKAPQRLLLNSTPFVRQYDILSNKWGAVHIISATIFLTFLSIFFISLQIVK